MPVAVRKLSLGVGLVIGCSVLLLGWDYLENRTRRSKPRVAIFQLASTPVLDDCIQGMLEELEAAGYKDGDNIELRHYNAENDNSMSNAIARQITDGSFDLVMTTSTPPCKSWRQPISSGACSFSAVADPFAAGVGLDRNDPLHHPRHLVGYGTLLPVDRHLKYARKLSRPPQTWRGPQPFGNEFACSMAMAGRPARTLDRDNRRPCREQRLGQGSHRFGDRPRRGSDLDRWR